MLPSLQHHDQYMMLPASGARNDRLFIITDSGHDFMHLAGVQMDTGICDLPADCLAQIASLTTPGDACRLAATAAALRVAADSDVVWGSFLRAECAGVLDRLSTGDKPPQGEGETKKKFFSRLCDSYVLIDNGNLSFSLERRNSCAKKYMISAKALCYRWSGCPHGGLVWSRGYPFSRFPEVAVFSHVCWMDVYNVFNTMNLLGVGTGYAAYIVHMVHWLHKNRALNQNKQATGSSSSTICNHECNHHMPYQHSRSPLWDWELDGSSSSHVMIDTTEKNRSRKRRLKPDGVSIRSDGRWIEQEINIDLDELCRKGKEHNVWLEFRGLTGSHGCQIIIEGIEIRPRAMDSCTCG